MIPLGKEQHLGSKALTLFIVRKVFPAVIFLFLAIIAIPIRNAILNWINTAPATINFSDQAINSVTVIFSLIIVIFFLLAILFAVFGVIISFLEYRTYTFTLEEFDLKICAALLV